MNIASTQTADRVLPVKVLPAKDLAVKDLAAKELTPVQRTRQAKLADAAQQFEGMMLQELLKPLQAGKDGDESGGGGFGTGDADRDTSLDTISSYGTEAVATAIAKAGGLGIARQVMRQIGIADGQIRK
jgi:Rod binding domain-containing protein